MDFTAIILALVGALFSLALVVLYEHAISYRSIPAQFFGTWHCVKLHQKRVSDIEYQKLGELTGRTALRWRTSCDVSTGKTLVI